MLPKQDLYESDLRILKLVLGTFKRVHIPQRKADKKKYQIVYPLSNSIRNRKVKRMVIYLLESHSSPQPPNKNPIFKTNSRRSALTR